MMITDLQTTAAEAAKRKVHIETWGCQMNVADSERMLSVLKTSNYELTQNIDEANLVLLNTCHIREKARHKVLSRLGVLNELKSRNKGVKIAVTGCVAQADGKNLLELAPQIDVLIGPGKIDDLPQLLKDHETSGGQKISIGFDRHKEREHSENETDAQTKEPVEKSNHEIPSVSGKKEVTRFVNIIQGCNNFCTFCVVPFTRGREISRTLTEIVDEVKQMVHSGAREITLLGQNVNSYGLDLLHTDIVPDDGGPFVELLKSVAKIPGLQRLRFTTSNPHDFTKPLADLFAVEPKLGRYIHLPVQAGHDRTLERMKRKVTVEEYMTRINWIRSAVPDMALSTDLIVGFPGETEAEFEGTLDLVRKVKFSFAYAFKYSPRKGTAAARFLDQIPEAVKDARLAKLNQTQDEITLALNQAEFGQTRDVLYFYESPKEPGIFVGRTEHFRTVRTKSSVNIVGQILPTRMVSGNKIALLGELV